MSDLRLVSTSEDGARLLLVSDTGEQFTLAIDARLRTALRGGPARPGQRESTMDSALRPRDIQTRIRHGESPESVAQAAGVPVERILTYAGPVLDERAHVAQRAQRSSVRRGTPDPAGAIAVRTLGDAVTAMLRRQGTDPEIVEWDAWRRDDGRWSLQGTYEAPGRSGAAAFTFDTPGNYVTLDNDDAQWLVGELADQPEPAPASDDLRSRRRRLSAVEEPGAVDDQLSIEDELGSDALDLVRNEDGTATSGPDQPPFSESYAAAPTGTDPAAGDPVDGEPATARPARRRGRASVPSWDEIMFGGERQD